MKRGTLLAVMLCALPVQAQDTGLSLMRIGINARAGAMGDAQVAATRNAFATYWNPAGLADAENSLGASHRIWVGDLRAYDIAARLPAGTRGAWGLALMATDSGSLEARDSPGDPDGTFSAQFLSFGTSYARVLSILRIGVSAKFLRERIFNTSATGYALDAGVQVDVLKGLATLGAAYRNAGRMSVLEQQRTPLPRLVQTGVAIHPFQIVAGSDETRILDLMASLEMSHLFASRLTRLHAGLSVTIMELVDLRGGYVSRDELRNFTFGVGLRFTSIMMDYAFIPFEEGFNDPGHVLSLSYAW
ncbi:MAG: PorV/PorQ family protein [Bacteroidota bacterium]|nr:PorV/PorQ family protein [Bacteroidota bacterium]